jgi:hypothetical protein
MIARTDFANGTWLEPEDAINQGKRGRRARVLCPDGVCRIFRAGVPDEIIVPVAGVMNGRHVRGYAQIDHDNCLVFVELQRNTN